MPLETFTKDNQDYCRVYAEAILKNYHYNVYKNTACRDNQGNWIEIDKQVLIKDKFKKYKGKTSAFDAAVKKKYPKEYDTNAVQDLIKKHAEMNEQMMFDEGKKLKSGVDAVSYTHLTLPTKRIV